jgi:outer membrane lipoprotein carrier protein
MAATAWFSLSPTGCATRVRVLGVGVLLLLLAAVPVRAQDGSELLDEVQRRYDTVETLRASFTQTVTSSFSPEATRVDGQLWVKDDMYRVETVEQTLVTDGTTTWIYTPADSQVVVNDADRGGAALSPESFFTDYSDRYAVEDARRARQDGASHTVLNLTASAPAARFESVALWVRDADRLITRLRVVDSGGSTIDIRLRDIQVNSTLSDASFRFEPPGGTEVVDLRTGE